MLFSFYHDLSDGKLLNFLLGLCAFNEESGDEVNLEAAWITKVLGGKTVYQEKYLASAAGGAGPAATAAKNAARAAVIEILDGFTHTQVKYNPLFTLEKLILAGWPEPEESNTGKIGESPTLGLSQTEHGLIKGIAQCKSKVGRGMAPFAEAVEFQWNYKNEDGSFPSDEDPGYSVFSFAAAAEWAIPTASKAKEIVVRARYHNRYPDPGPWSDPAFMVIA
jgi:hypothetical protein